MCAPPTDDPRWAEVLRFSRWCGDSPTLVKAFQELAAREIQTPGYSAARAELLTWIGPRHRREWDNPSLDRDLVKQWIHRLRQKLHEYYEREQATSECLISLVNQTGGGYGVRFYIRSARPAASRNLAAFWSGFGDPERPPVVVYSNNELVQEADGALREYRSARTRHMLDDPSEIADGPDLVLLTGVGEVAGVACLQEFFLTLGVEADFVRSRLVPVREIRERPTVYLGSPLSNRLLGALDQRRSGGQQRGFLFEEVRQPDGSVHFCLVDRTGRRLERHRSPDGYCWFDYALVCRLTKANGAHDLILAGTTTHGTQAAAEFVCNAAGAGSLMERLGPDAPCDFEAVLEVSVVNGAPGQTVLLEGSATRLTGASG
jgi:hypothetical protein